jgi:hypothetical protein
VAAAVAVISAVTVAEVSVFVAYTVIIILFFISRWRSRW